MEVDDTGRLCPELGTVQYHVAHFCSDSRRDSVLLQHYYLLGELTFSHHHGSVHFAHVPERMVFTETGVADDCNYR